MTIGSVASPPAPSTPQAERRRDLERLATETFDLLVVGGGITGSGILLDAASRGLRAALVERDDFAVGTSGRSSRLIHGGLRYLEQFRIELVREALSERARLLRLAPHLVPDRAVRLPDLRWPAHPAVLRRRADPVRPARGRRRWRPTPPPVRRRGARGHPGPAPTPAPRCVRLPRRPGGRRPVQPGRGADRARSRCPRGHPAERDPVARDRRPDRRRDGPRRADRGHVRHPRRTGRRRDRGVVRPGGRAVPGARGRPRGPAEPGQPPHRPAGSDPERPRPHAPDPGPGLLPRPVAGSLGDRHDRPRRRRIAGPARAHLEGGRPDPGQRQRDPRDRPHPE